MSKYDIDHEYDNVTYLRFKAKRIIRINGVPVWNRIPTLPNCRYITEGGIYDHSAHLIYESVRKGGMEGDHVVCNSPLIMNKENRTLDIIRGSSIYIGNFFNHYGHFITEGISRFRAAEDYGRYDNILISPFIFDYGAVNIKEFHKFFFSCFNLPIDRLKVLTKNVKIEKLKIAKQLWTINGDVDVKIRDNYSLIRNSISCDDSHYEGCYFISRKDRLNYNRIKNISEIEDLMRSFGVKIIYSEDLTITEQISIYKSANAIFTVSGSGAHNILFMNKKSKLIEIADSRTPVTPIKMQMLANQVAEANYIFVKYKGDMIGNWDLGALKNEISESMKDI
ncbi:TPA: glycosyltransferase family 61 protein [Raoultella ornithinolytica]|nr:glycosyltransferase family 61 protein [Raoultella ornithinolytica]